MTRQMSANPATNPGVDKGVVIFPKYSGRARGADVQESVQAQLQPFGVHVGDLCRKPDEDRIRDAVKDEACSRCVIILPGTTIPGGCHKDRKRASAAVTLLNELCHRGAVGLLCLPKAAPALNIPEVQMLRRHPHCQIGVVDLCAIGGVVSSAGTTHPMRKQYIVMVVSNKKVDCTSFFQRCSCGHGVVHDTEKDTLMQPRSSMLSLARHLLTSAATLVQKSSKHVAFQLEPPRDACFPSSSTSQVSTGQSSDYSQCPGCRGHKGALDSSHTRKIGECRWSDVSEATQKARAFAPRVSQGRSSSSDVLRESRHAVPMSAEQQVEVVRDTDHTSHAAGSVVSPGLADEVIETTAAEDAVDAAITKLLRDAPTAEEWTSQQQQAAAQPKAQQEKKVDAESQATHPDDMPDWSAWDLRKVGKWLRDTTNINKIRAVLRRLHVRWWHASPDKMEQILRTCGVSDVVLSEVRLVCETCSICRKWRKPNPQPKTTARFSTDFNQALQMDIMFIERRAVVHLIDEATRFSVACFVPSVEDQSLIAVLGHEWFRIFGPPTTLVCDQEGGIMSDWAGVQLSKWGVNRMALPERTHASVVERHHAILRDTFLKVRDQCISDGIPYTDSLILCECVFCKNTITNIGGFSPYQAVFGRTPPLMMNDFENAPHEALRDDDSMGAVGQATRLRELAMSCITEALASDRVKRALKAQTHKSSMELQLEHGCLVDFYRAPIGKERPGWRGPARIVDMSSLHDTGILHVLWQGRILSVSATDVRRHLVLLSMLCLDSHAHAYMIQFTESLLDGKAEMFAYVKVPGKGQIPSKAIRNNEHMWKVLLDIARLDLGMPEVKCIVLGRALKAVPGVPSCMKTLILSWFIGKGNQHLEHEVDGAKRISMKDLLGEQWFHQCVAVFMSIEPGDREVGEDDMTPSHVQAEAATQGRNHDREDVELGATNVDAAAGAGDQQVLPMNGANSTSDATAVQSDGHIANGRGTPLPAVAVAAPGAHDRLSNRISSPTAVAAAGPLGSHDRRYNHDLTWTRDRSRSRDRTAELDHDHTMDDLMHEDSQEKFGQHRGDHDYEMDQRMRENDGDDSEDHDYEMDQRMRENDGDDSENHDYEMDQRMHDHRNDDLRDSFSHASRSRSRSHGMASRSRDDSVGMASRSRDDSVGMASRSRDDSVGMASRSRDDSVGMASRSRDDSVGENQHRVNSAASRSRDDSQSTTSSMFALENKVMSCTCIEEVLHELGIAVPCDKELAHARKQRENLHLSVHAQNQVFPQQLPGAWGMDVTKHDEVKHVEEILVGKRDEVTSWVDHDVLEAIPLSSARNVVDARWVLRWKYQEGGERKVKARLCLRGFRDQQKCDLDTVAFTASRLSQRVVSSLSVLFQWSMISLDISTAFLQGGYFDKDEDRLVCVRMTREMLQLFQEHERFAHVDSARHTFRLKKPAYGLVDAPRAWFNELVKTLVTLGWQQSLADPALVFKRQGDVPLGFMTLHVDDLKVCGPDNELKLLETQLTKRFGKLKRQEGTFEHTGIMHVCNDDGVRMHQHHYLDKIDTLTREQLTVCKEKSHQPCGDEFHQLFRSMLGRVAWTVSTRPEAAVLASVFQSSANAPSHDDLLRLNLVAKWLKTHPSEIYYPRMSGPFQLVLVSDASFKGDDETRHARRGEVLLLCPRRSNLSGVVHVLDYSSKKIPRVTKSTYSAELHSLSSGVDHAILVAMMFEEMMRSEWNKSLSAFEDYAAKGVLHVPITLVVDARSVYMSLTSKDVKLPEEQPLILLVLQLRELFMKGLVSRVCWCSTVDMIADGLSKNSVSRDALLNLCKTARWRVQYPTSQHTHLGS
eukprot:6491381-Amphidinium_carterae.1